MVPLVGSALIGAAGSLFGGILGSASQNSTNKTNLQIARETNKANRENQEYQNQWNLEMWNKQNEYNSPAAQRSRLEAAGLNPVTNGLDGTGNAGSLTSAEYTATPGAPMENSGAFMADGLMNAARQYAEIKNIEASTKKTEEETTQTELINSITKATQNDVIDGAHYQMLVTKGTVDVTENQAKLLNKQYDEAGKHIDLMEQSIKQIQQSMKLDKFKAIVDATAQYIHLNNEQTKQFQDFFIQLYRCNLEKQRLALDTRVGNAQIQLLGNQSKVADETAKGLSFQNSINEKRKQLGIIDNQVSKEKRQLIWDLEFLDDKNILGIITGEKMYEKLRHETSITATEAEWAEFNQLLNAYSTIISSATSIKSLIPTTELNDNTYTVTY
ncbi:MAG: hypothetical protein HDS52_04815 [Barnesiella sp.]|nr:hypothetical protein [Barnesiella sp.]